MENVNSDLLMMIVGVIIAAAAAVVGRYVIPKIPKDKVTEATNTVNMVLEYASSFCAYAKQFMQTSTGEEKMEYVVEMVTDVCVANGIDIDEKQLRAICQRAYNIMKAELAKTETPVVGLLDIAEPIKEFPPVETQTEPDTNEHE